MSNTETDKKKINIVMTMGSKGGVGKTTAAATLVDWYKFLGVPVTLLDLDDENKNHGGLQSYHPDAAKISTHSPSGYDVILDQVAAGKSTKLVVDMAAASGKQFLAWFEELYGAFSDYRVEFILLCLITTDPSSVSNTLIWANELQGRVRYVIVKNPMQNEHAAFEYWSENVLEVAAFKKEFKPVEIELPAIMHGIADHLTNNKLTLHAAVEMARTDLPEVLRDFKTTYRMRSLRDKIFKEFESIRQELL